MAMIVQHNITAMNSNRMLGVTTGSQAKSTEKLSSGFKINRAADDAAGLTISEKMRKQIRGLTQASTNAQDGVSSVQTAEGALTEVHSMLQRMNQLATQAANGTNSKSDRKAIQDEIDQLTTEIDRVAETTKFNEIYLLKGDEGTKTVTMQPHDAGLKGTLVDNGDGTATFKMDPLKDGDKVSIGGKDYIIASTKTETDALITKAAGKTPPEDIEINGETYKYIAAAGGAGDDSDADNAIAGYYKDGTWKAGEAKAAADLQTLAKDGSTVKVGKESLTSIVDANSDGVDDTKDNIITVDKAYELAAKELLAANQIGDVNGTAAVTNADATEGTLGTLTFTGTLTATDFGTVTLGTFTGTSTDGNVTVDATGYTGTDGAVLVYTDGNETNAGNGGTKLNIPAGWYTKGDYDTLKANTLDTGDLTGVATPAVDVTNSYLGAIITGVPAAAGATITFTKAPDAYVAFADEDAMKAALAANPPVTIYKGDKDTTAPAADYTYTPGIAATAGTANGEFTINMGSADVAKTLSFNLHVGADADMTNKIQVDIDTMNAAGLGVKGLNVTDGSGNAATYAIDAIQDAISKVSAQRSALGAVQNRLEHTIANVDNIVENTTAAESRIRDTDMAKEMVEYSKNNILAQAGQAMLAQANQSNQGVLGLLG